MVEHDRVIYPELSYQVIGILFKVHNELGRYCNEKQYGDAIERHLKELGLKYKRELVLERSFESEGMGRNRIDFLVDDKIILELKAKRIIEREDYFQMRRYLFSGKKKLGILVNFQQKYIAPKRVLNSKV